MQEMHISTVHIFFCIELSITTIQQGKQKSLLVEEGFRAQWTKQTGYFVLYARL